MSNLYLKICEEEERVIHLRSKDLFRPPLKQLGNSICEIKTHYMTNEKINVVPFKCPPRLAQIRVTLLKHLGEDSFLHSNNIVTGSTIEWTSDQEQCSPSLVVLMDSLALAMDFGISPKPSDVQCDILLAICGQPVIVLTLVDEDKDHRNVRRYNASVARGVTSTLRKFMDESLNVVSGVMHVQDMDTMDTFKTSVAKLAKNSGLFVTPSSFTTSPSKYEKIVTAFWTGVSETRSVISSDGRVDSDYLRFLTKDQCIILMENINNREVEVQFQSGTGATTLMVEVARRLLKLDNTLLVCSSQEERERLRSVYPNTEIADVLTVSKLSTYTNVVGETGDIDGHVSGRLWNFRKADTETEQLQQDFGMTMLEKENPNSGIHISSGAEKGDLEHLSMESLKMSHINTLGHLLQKISVQEEQVFDLRSKDLYRPALKQIGNSICDIKAHYMSNGQISSVPKECPPRLARIRSTLLNHLREGSFLYKYNIVTGSTIEHTADQERRSPSIVALMDSLALAMDIEISHYTSDVQCDSLLTIFGQPVILLTLVDRAINCRNVRRYNASVARGVTSTLRKFMDESLNIVSGVMHLQDMDTMDTFEASITTIAKNSGLFVTPSSLTTNPTRYEKIVTAFWAGVAETRSVISGDGRVDTDYLRFLTKDQCIILMENINNREVDIQFQPGTGATTLMVEVARRLSRLDRTIFVCGSQEEKERLRFVDINVETSENLKSTDVSKYTNIVDETGTVTGQIGGKFWKYLTETDILQNSIAMFEEENANREKTILLISSVDRQHKYRHLSTEVETLKLFDISFKGLLSAYHLPESLALEFLPVKHDPSGKGGRDVRLEKEDYVRDVLDQLKLGIRERRDLFPLLGYMMKHTKGRISDVQAQVDFLEIATSDGAEVEDWKNQADVPLDQDVWSIEHTKHGEKTDGRHKTEPAKPPVRLTVQGKRDQNLIHEIEDDEDQALDQVNPGKQERRKFSKFISKMKKRVKGFLPSLKAKVRNPKPASSSRGYMEDNTIQAEISVDHDVPSMKLNKQGELIDEEHKRSGEQMGEEHQNPEEQVDEDYKRPGEQLEEEHKRHGEHMGEEHKRPREQIDEEHNTGSTQLPKTETEEKKVVLGEKTGETQVTTVYVNEVTDVETIAELKDRLKMLKMGADSQERDLLELREETNHGVEWEYNMGCLAEELSTLKIRDIVTDVIGEDELPVQTKPHKKLTVEDRITMIPELKRGQIYHLREREYGTLKERHILDILKIVIKDDQSRLTYLRAQSDHLECVYGSPIHMVGEIDTDHGGPVSCPPMTLNSERMHEDLAVSGDGLELVNWRGRSLDHPTDRFKNYCGTSSRLPIPLPPSPSTLTAATYWETHARLQVKKYVSMWPLLELAVCGEGKVDTGVFVSLQSRSSWALLLVGDCYEHRGVCTQVCENNRQVGECQTDTMSRTPGTDVTLKYGIALDVGRGRLAFIDVNRGRVLHKFDVNFRESLFPMFGVWPSPDYVHATMRLISGREVAMTGEKQQLIAQALFCK